jgi:ABC-2 type transport system ATP-binding protein
MLELAAEGVFKRFGRVKALDGLTMRFEPGLLHTLIGPNGAGKTTLMRMIAGLLRPDSGRIVFREGGAEVPFEAVRSRIAYMPQANCLYGDLSVTEHLAFFAKLYGVRGQAYKTWRDELLRLSHLEHFLDRPAGDLSGGMYKMLGAMCAMLANPEILLLDEPTTGVDPVSRRQFWQLFHELALRSGVTILITSAYMDEGERSARIHLFEKGRTLIEGEPDAVLRAEKAADLQELFLRGRAA